MKNNTDKETATACQKTPEIASINGQLLEEIKYYKAHADKLAEALRDVLQWFSEPYDPSPKSLPQAKAALSAYDQQSRGEALRESEAAPAFKQSGAVWIDALREMHAFIESIIEGESEPSLEQCVDARETAKAALVAYESEAQS